VIERLEPDEPKAQFLLSVSKLARDKTHWTVGVEPGDQGKVFKTATFLWRQWSKSSMRPNKQPDSYILAVLFTRAIITRDRKAKGKGSIRNNTYSGLRESLVHWQT
jgi:hypothetical protein